MPKEIIIKRIISSSINPDMTMDITIETEDNEIFIIKGVYPLTREDKEREVTLDFNAKKLDNPIISEKQNSFINFINAL